MEKGSEKSDGDGGLTPEGNFQNYSLSFENTKKKTKLPSHSNNAAGAFQEGHKTVKTLGAIRHVKIVSQCNV